MTNIQFDCTSYRVATVFFFYSVKKWANSASKHDWLWFLFNYNGRSLANLADITIIPCQIFNNIHACLEVAKNSTISLRINSLLFNKPFAFSHCAICRQLRLLFCTHAKTHCFKNNKLIVKRSELIVLRENKSHSELSQCNWEKLGYKEVG